MWNVFQNEVSKRSIEILEKFVIWEEVNAIQVNFQSKVKLQCLISSYCVIVFVCLFVVVFLHFSLEIVCVCVC